MRAWLTAPLLTLALLALPAAAHDELPGGLPFEHLPVPVPGMSGDGVSQFSDDMRLVANWNDGHTYRQGSDLAFWGDTAVLGNFGVPGGFRLVDIGDPAAPTEVGQFVCEGSQADVSVYRDLVFLSVDSPRTAPACGSGPAPAAQVTAGQAWEGVRVVSIADPANRSRSPPSTPTAARTPTRSCPTRPTGGS